MDIKEKAAYIKGLADGYELDKSGKEGRIISEMLDLIGTLAERICELESECGELREYIEEIDEDLGAVEDDLYLDDGEDDDFEERFDNDFEDDDDSGYDEFECPACGETICVDDSIALEDVICPSCGEKIGDIEICDGDCSECEGCEE